MAPIQGQCAVLARTALDQASAVHAEPPRAVQVIAVTSGKGGVGKTNVSVNLALAMAEEGKQVMLLDADFGLANVDVLLGLRPSHTLADVLSGNRTLEEIIVDGPLGVRVVPASSGIQRMAELTHMQRAGVIRAFSHLGHNLDVLLIDTAAGISGDVTVFARAAQEVIVVVCDEPTSITDAYATIKVLNRDHGINRFHIVCNMVQDLKEGRDLYTKLMMVSNRFLDVQLDFMGMVPYDESLRKAVQRQNAVVAAYPRSKAARAFRILAKSASLWPVPHSAGGHVEFFVERLIQVKQEMESPL